MRIPIGRGFAGRIAATHRPVILDDVDHADVFNPILREKGIKSMLGVPLLIEDKMLGVLHVGTLTPRAFDKGDLELLQLVADRVALAIERARLHEEVVMLDQLKLNFVAIASHELRTPATSVYGVLATLVERGERFRPRRATSCMRVGYEQGDRLRRLLEQLLDLSRLDAQASTVQKRPIVLHTVLVEIVATAVPRHARGHRRAARSGGRRRPAGARPGRSRTCSSTRVRYGKPPIVVAADCTRPAPSHLGRGRGPGVPDGVRAAALRALRPRRATLAAAGSASRSRARYARAHGGDLVYERGEQGARFDLLLGDG